MIWGKKKGNLKGKVLHPYCPSLSPTITKKKKKKAGGATSNCMAGSLGTNDILLWVREVNNISITQAGKAGSAWVKHLGTCRYG